VVTNVEAIPARMSGTRKAATLLVSLGEETSALVLRHMDDDEIQMISREVARVASVSGELAEIVLEEFYQLSVAHDYMIRGGLDYARKVLHTAFGPVEGKRKLDRLLKALGGETMSFDMLQKADPQQLAKFIHSEHPQTIALILSHLNAVQAAGLLSSLPADIRSDVSVRMANLDQISPEIMTKIATIITMKIRELGEVNREQTGGVKAVAEMFNRLDSTSSKEILEGMEQADPKLVETIRHLMFVFEDLLLLDENGIKEVLSRVDRKVLTVALKGTSEKLRDNFLKAMSARGAEMLKEDMEAMGPVKIKEVEAAQQQIIAVVRQLEAEGVLSLKGGGGGDQYVV